MKGEDWTKGPWYAVGRWVEQEKEDRPDICNCNPRSMGQEHLLIDDKEVDANARLIAEAPELYTTLKWAVDVIKDCLLVEHGKDAKMLNRAMSALKRARGGV